LNSVQTFQNSLIAGNNAFGIIVEKSVRVKIVPILDKYAIEKEVYLILKNEILDASICGI
jgi:hypothetical protein